ncbi:peptidoglycan-associated lipoprotein Pal [Azohydromonas sp.]|uniref:peptidoglycan-associated lipoprotein Pal n=1 Tax=Azohydromonas sp. TaxID=1872666 RepID=UPI002BD5DAAE|nr:peptidoglycan-associated lipoprotein Pal [Azohydromonas sp.]HMM84117.1 peptidoglycan-associated lipoprotein Pal [Azohydromonas sp.]
MTSMRATLATGLLALAALGLAGCSTPVKLDDKAPPVESRTPVPVDGAAAGAAGSGATGAGAGQSQVASVDLGRQAAAATTLDRVVYFDFDSYVVKGEFQPLVEAHAKRLVANRNQRVVIEGHTDERGGREYNLALGQRRAEAVLRSLTLLGVDDAQLEAVSFGEERPAVAASNEDAWAKNRRAELKDR